MSLHCMHKFEPGAHRGKRDGGFAILTLLAAMVAIAGLVGVLVLSSNTTSHAVYESQQQLEVYQVADAGAQIALKELRDSGGKEFSLTEEIMGGSVAVEVTEVEPHLYQIRSTGKLNDLTKVIDLHVRSGALTLPGAVSMGYDGTLPTTGGGGDGDDDDEGGGGTISATFVATMANSANIDGHDHSVDGSYESSQEHANCGLAVPSPWTLALTIGTGSASGVPSSSTALASNEYSVLNHIADYVATNATTTWSGSQTISSNQGSKSSPTLVHASLSNGHQLEFQNASGYGVLLVDVNGTLSRDALIFRGSSSWTGLVIVRVASTADGFDSHYLVDMSNNTAIQGGLTFVLNPVAGSPPTGGDGDDDDDGGGSVGSPWSNVLGLDMANSASVVTSQEALNFAVPSAVVGGAYQVIATEGK